MSLLFALSLGASLAAATQPDSLTVAFEQATHDTTRLKILDALIEKNSQDYVLLEKYSRQMEDFSKANAETTSGALHKTYVHYYATAINNLAYVEENKSNNPLAIGMYKDALAKFRTIDDKPGVAMCLTNLGFISKQTGDLASAIKYYNESIDVAREAKDDTGTFFALNNLGVTFYALGDIKKALSFYFEAIKVAEKMNDKRRQARILNNIAGVYQGQKEPKLYREYLEKAFAMAMASGEERGQAAILNNLIVELIAAKEYDTAQIHADRVYEIAKKLSDKQLIANSLSSLSLVSRAKGNFEDAIRYETESLALKRSLDFKNGIIGSLNSIGETYIKFKKYKEALPYLLEAADISRATAYLRGVERASKNLSETYKLLGNSSKALEYYQLHVTTRDSVANEENRKATFKSQYKYEYEIKAAADSVRAQDEKAILSAQLSQEKSQRYALTAAIILGVTLASFGFYRFRVKQQMKELKLRNRIASDLHDEVGSAISSISLFAGMAKMKSLQETEAIVAKIENTSRETVDNMSDIVWSIEPSNDRFDNVLRKMNYFGDQLLGSMGIGFTFNYKEGIEKSSFDMAKRKNIYLIYKEAINNAAKYSGAKNVRVELSKEGRNYEMEISDDGKGFDTQLSTMGNGLRNMKRRAEEMDGQLIISSTEKGTVITLTV